MDTPAVVVESVTSKEDLAELIDELRRDLVYNADTWENTDLATYLEAISAWLRDLDGYYENRGEPVPSNPSWKVMGEILLAARTYE